MTTTVSESDVTYLATICLRSPLPVLSSYTESPNAFAQSVTVATTSLAHSPCNGHSFKGTTL